MIYTVFEPSYQDLHCIWAISQGSTLFAPVPGLDLRAIKVRSVKVIGQKHDISTKFET